MVCSLCHKSGHNIKTCHRYNTAVDIEIFKCMNNLINSVIHISTSKPNATNKSRKNCECPISELIAAVLMGNMNILDSINTIEDIIKNSSNIIVTNLDGYIEDSKTKTGEYLVDKIKQDKQYIVDSPDMLVLKDIKLTLYLTGKSYSKYNEIMKLNESVKDNKRDKHTKADIYIDYNEDTVDTVDNWLAISIKEDDKCQFSNWSIEKSIIKDSNISAECKQMRENILKDCGFERDWRKNKSTTEIIQIRKNFNVLLSDKSYELKDYIDTIDIYIRNNPNIIKKIVAEIIGSKIDHYRMLLYDGRNFKDLRKIYDNINKSTIEIIKDDKLYKSTITFINKLRKNTKLHSHYSPTACKKWYFIKIDNIIEYRFEIRWKGDCYASPQLLIYNL